MVAPRIDRRLAAILAADVVGYSRLMQRDEQGTLDRVRTHRKEFIEPLIAEHKGRIVKLMGDGLLVEFGSAVDAVRCAVLIQQGMAEREAGVAEAEKIRLRIGINLGDVIHEEGDVYGDGVNIAARLEGLAKPGGICIARNIHNQVKGKLAFRFAPMGPQRVKNIAEPIEVWRVLPDGTTARATPVRRRLTFKPALAAALALLLLIGAGAGGWWWYESQAEDLALPAKSSIAVLPLTNFSGDPKWGRLADGISEDIITDLARHPDLFVIARNSSFAYKDKPVDVKQVGRELGVRYVLEGSLQADAGRVRVTAQLIDAATGGHLWAERYDRPEGELFAIQDEVVGKVVGALGGWYGKLAETERAQARRKPPADLEVYDLYLLGIEQKHQYTKESSAEAIRLLSRAVEHDPGFARAWIALGITHSVAAISGFAEDPVAATDLYVEYIKKGVALDPFDPVGHVHLAAVRAIEGDLSGAAAAFDQALAVAPNDADVLAMVAKDMTMVVGRAAENVRHGEHAVALNPVTPAWYFTNLGAARYVAGDYAQALETLRRAPPDSAETLMYLAMAHAQLGQAEEAKKLASRITTEFPSFTVEGYIRDFPVTAQEALAAIRDGATKAGLLPLPT